MPESRFHQPNGKEMTPMVAATGPKADGSAS